MSAHDYLENLRETLNIMDDALPWLERSYTKCQTMRYTAKLLQIVQKTKDYCQQYLPPSPAQQVVQAESDSAASQEMIEYE